MAGRGSVPGLSSLQKTALLLGVPAAATVCYILYRRYRESREVPVTLVADEGLEVGLRVPRTALKALIGRRGATINQLRRETGAQIAVEEEEEEEEEAAAAGGRSLVQISGSPGQVCRARAAVLRIVADSAPVAEQLCVPQRAVGRIIGRGGETVRGICRSSGARVDCGHEPGAGLAPVRVIRLLGTRREVEAAKKLIMEKLAEDKALHRELAQAAAARCPRKQPLGSRREPPPEPPPGAPGSAGGWRECWDNDWAPEAAAGSAAMETGQTEAADEGEEHRDGSEQHRDGSEQHRDGSEEHRDGTEQHRDGSEEPPVAKFEVPSPDFGCPADEQLDVYVSAAESPGRFWVQLLGARSLQLDQLRAQMGHFYRSSPPVPPPSLHPGAIVAAPCPAEGEWRRARVVAPRDSGHLELSYLDFGDIGEATPEALRALRSDFLSLPFQAIECSLAGIVPNGGRWPAPALQEFRRLTGCARRAPLRARICSYGPAGPRLRLLAHGQSLDVGAELVRLGYAVPGPPEEPPDNLGCASAPSPPEPGASPGTPPCLSPPAAAAAAAVPGDAAPVT